MPKYSFEDLQTLMARLRDPVDGCPWDLKQSWQTIPAYTLEEVYEVVDAIENEDWAHVQEELGDLLFQVIFYGQFAKEQQLFSMDDVVDGIVSKLIRRHPHVFPEGTLESRRAPDQTITEQEIAATWDAIKAAEKKEQPATEKPTSCFDDIPKAFPALQMAEKIQKKAAKQQFDWPNINGVYDKLHEEVDELKQACQQLGQEEIEDELGDLLFSVVNLARHLKADPETVLRRANQKFVQRFDKMKTLAEDQQTEFATLALVEKEALWQQAKKKLNNEP
jgi:ATP diphosphatase